MRRLRLGALKLQQIIEQGGVLQKELAERTLLDKALISKYVRGVMVPGAKHRKLIKDATGISSDDWDVDLEPAPLPADDVRSAAPQG
ncbi:MAG: helix-turn-helix transcriptional regulator [Polyangia bacterium]